MAVYKISTRWTDNPAQTDEALFVAPLFSKYNIVFIGDANGYTGERPTVYANTNVNDLVVVVDGMTVIGFARLTEKMSVRNVLELNPFEWGFVKQGDIAIAKTTDIYWLNREEIQDLRNRMQQAGVCFVPGRINSVVGSETFFEDEWKKIVESPSFFQGCVRQPLTKNLDA